MNNFVKQSIEAIVVVFWLIRSKIMFQTECQTFPMKRNVKNYLNYSRQVSGKMSEEIKNWNEKLVNYLLLGVAT